MSKRIGIFIKFIQTFARYTLHVREVIGVLLLLIVLSAFVISSLENINLSDAIYFAFITGLSIGYGDISPGTTIGKFVSIGIGFIGMLFIGITVAIANRALAATVKDHLHTST